MHFIASYSEFPWRWSQKDQLGYAEVPVHECTTEFRMVEKSFMSTSNTANLRITEVR